MIRWRDPRAPLTAAAAIGAASFAAALAAGAQPLTIGVTVALPVMAALMLLRSSRVLTDHRPAVLATRWLAGGALLWAAGVGVRPLAESSSLVVTFADVLVLLGAGLLAAGSVLAARRGPGIRAVLRRLPDAYICTAALFLIGWVLAISRIDGGPPGFGFVLLTPMLCLLLTCTAALAAATGTSAARPLGLAAAGALAAVTAGELVTGVARLTGGAPPAWAVMLAPVALLLLGAVPWAALRHAGSEDAREPAGPVVDHLLAALPIALAVAAACALVVHVARWAGRPPVTAVAVVAASIVLIFAVRLFVLMAANARLRRLVSLGDRQLRQLAESSGDVVLLCDYEGVIREVGPGVEATYGYLAADVAGRSIFDYIHPEDVPGIQGALAGMHLEDEPGPAACLIACRVRAADGTWRPTESVATRHVGGEDLMLVTTRDISDQEALRHQVVHLTFHDGITGLPNRAYFEERTREVLDTGRDAVAVIFLDLDGFTAVNDSVGHASGDYLLGQAARRLRAAVRPDDTLARWGGDEFAVLVETEAQSAVDLAERLVRAVSQEPFRVADRDVALTASVGVAFAEDGVPSGDLIRNADVAMARAKELGGRRVEVFAAHMHADVVRRLEIAADLQRALMEGQFAIEYQPVVDLATSRVTAVEALVRWWRGSTFVPPEQFLGPAEDTGLIVPLSEWILREACHEVAAWRASSWDIGLSLNLSARQITAPRFVETVEQALADSGLPASALTLEVIEEMLVEDAEETISRLSELRSLGVRLAIDDFGTGYASLAFLRQLPVDMIKIDPSFVSGLGRDDTLTLLTRTIVRLGHDLGLIVVAEGIERPEQLELLREMGCTRGQGFLVARPMAARGVDSLMRTSLTV
ncbi:putative bifunctional diguanylate cyclase/phosphodiesterase [Thermoactinospora rubra]|uniref:putative bifunctional diguanylate cyclase/phosphodiesterase n=1 Tax=Thermoactinospora rubra TaxID=1088767 RepID=UPI001F0A2786|nr:bifunctional diguanylate cyclase/phosphodiesterase [Thermoactinospora rubra]